MPRPRKIIRTTYEPPTKEGWYAYSHADGPFRVFYLNKESLESAKERYDVCKALGLPFVDVWSTRRLKKRERS